MGLNRDEMLAIVDATHGQPFNILGPHAVEAQGKRALVVRSFQPDARAVTVIDRASGAVLAQAQRLHDNGFFEASLPSQASADGYRLHLELYSGGSIDLDDPYAFESQLSDFDLHLMREGTHYRIWEKLGAHPMTVRGASGVHFAVWAPNAKRVSVVGDFNCWDGRRHCMRHHEGNGIWEIFIPGMSPGDSYKYEIKTLDKDYVLLKADPYAFSTEMPPKTASKVYSLEGFEWTDQDWIEQRSKDGTLDRPISIYEVHLGSWMHVPHEARSLSYREAAEKLAVYAKDMGYTHVELLPITEHPFYGSWGYQTVSLFAPTSRFGSPHDLMAFIDIMHEHGIGVILDWVPAHFPSDEHGLANFDGTHLYEHADPRKGMHMDWNTLVFNYGRTEVWNFLLSSALFWLEAYHFDGIRVDAVASMLYLDYSRSEGEWLPNEHGGRENLDAVNFLKYLNVLLHREHPGVLTIAEESTAWTGVSRPTYVGGLGFSLKWNMGWMHDVLEYFSKEPIHRKYHSNTLTFGMLYAYTENFILPFSHDEVVYGKGSMLRKMPGDDWQKFANLRCLLGYMFGHPGKKHLFMGAEIAQWNEWDHNTSLDWHLLAFEPHKGVQNWVRDLHKVYREDKALWENDFTPGGFQWIDCHDSDNSVYSFVRFARDRNDFTVFVCNFTPVPRHNYRVGVPREGYYREILNSDASAYCGSNMGNSGGNWADPIPWQGYSHSVNLTVPPLATIVLKP